MIPHRKPSVNPADNFDMDDQVLVDAIIDDAVPSGRERRRSGRHHLHTLGTLRRLTTPEPHALQVLVLEMSLHGAGLRAPFDYALGDLYELSIGTHGELGGRPVRIRCCRPRPDGQFDIGVEFVLLRN